MSILSVDLGNENFLVAIPRRGGVDVINNQSSKRLSPTMVAFDNDRRYAGEFAQTQQTSNPFGTITNLKRLIGVRFKDPEREVIQKFITVPLVELADGFIGVKLTYNNSEKIFRIEQCLSLLISECFKIARLSGSFTNDCVIVVSPWWGEKQRRLVLDAAAICGFNVLKLVNSTTAAAICYSMFHRSKLPVEAEKSISVLIADIGDSAMNVAVAQLHQGNVEIKGFCCDEHLGGSHFTTALQNLLLQKVKDKYKLDPTNNARAMLRFRKGVEVTKKTLSINPVTRFEVPCLMNDIDVNIEVKRDEFEEVIQELVNRIQGPVEKAIELAGVKKENLSSIEIHGGGSRVALVKKKIASIFGKDPTQSLNPDECFALGGGFQAAILSPQYNVPLNVKDVSPHAVSIEYVDHEGNKKELELFKQFNQVPSTKKLPIKVLRTARIHMFCENEEIGTVQIDTGKDELLLVQVLIRLTPDSLIDVKSAVYYITKEEDAPPEEPKKEEPKKEEKKEGEEKKEEKKEGEEKKEEKKEGEEKKEEKKEGESPAQQEEPKKEEPPKKIIKKIEVKVNFDFTTSYGLANAMITEMKAQEKEMKLKDELEQKIDDVRNELETYLFRMNNGLTRDFPQYFDPSKKDLYLQKVSEVQDWFSDNEFDRLTFQEYEKQLQSLKEFGDPAIARKDSREKLPSTIKEFDIQADELTKRLSTKDDNFAHITEEDRAPAKKAVEEFKAWLIKKQEEVEKQAPHLEIAFKSFDAEFKINDLTSQVNKTMSKAKPPPPKPEPKPEDAKKEGGEGEPKPEGEQKAEGTPNEAAPPEGATAETKPPENPA